VITGIGRALVLTGAVLLAPGAGALAQASTSPGFQVVAGTFVAVQVPDLEAAATWYAETLGLRQANRIEADDGRYRIRILAASGLVVELIQLREAEPPSPGIRHGLFKAGFFVDDLAAAFRWLRSRGADMDGTTFVDEALNARTFVFRDPFGNRLQVFQSCEEACPAPDALP